MNDAPASWRPDPSASGVTLPPGATDTHVHVFGPTATFPFAEDARFRPGDAPKKALFALHGRYGIERCVIVQSGCHGFDNAVSADAMAARPGRYLGIALAPPDVADAELDRLAAQGFRGLRYNYMGHLAPGASMDELAALAPRLAGRDMHLQLHMEPGLIAGMAPTLARLPVPVVIDHMGRIDAGEGDRPTGWDDLRRLLDLPQIRVKVSGSERASRRAAPYDDAWPFAARLVADYPEQVLWGTDWPHPNIAAGPPDDGVLVGLLARIAPTPRAMQALLVDNPQRLYHFPVAA